MTTAQLQALQILAQARETISLDPLASLAALRFVIHAYDYVLDRPF